MKLDEIFGQEQRRQQFARTLSEKVLDLIAVQCNSELECQLVMVSVCERLMQHAAIAVRTEALRILTGAPSKD